MTWLKDDLGVPQGIFAVLVYVWIEGGVVLITDFFILLNVMIQLYSIGSTATEGVTRVERCHDS